MKPKCMVKGLTPRNLRVLADDLLEAMERGREAGPIERVPRLKDKDGTGGMSEEESELHDRLKTWRKRVADEEDMDSSLVLNRLVLVRLAKEQPKDRSGLQKIEGLAPWQVDAYAQSLLGILKQFEADLAAGLVPKRFRRGSRR